jgi:hypothetical protein
MNSDRKMGARSKLRDYFLRNLGKILSSDELREAAGGITEWARRVRELRNEEGYRILTHNDRAELKPGQYLLETAKPDPAFERSISKELRSLILDRNGFTCQMCGAGGGEPHPHDPSRKTRLHIGHIVDKSMGGSDDPSNLRTACSICNEGASNITPDRPSLIKLKAQVRKATSADQRILRDWLNEKFGEAR